MTLLKLIQEAPCNYHSAAIEFKKQTKTKKKETPGNHNRDCCCPDESFFPLNNYNNNFKIIVTTRERLGHVILRNFCIDQLIVELI